MLAWHDELTGFRTLASHARVTYDTAVVSGSFITKCLLHLVLAVRLLTVADMMNMGCSRPMVDTLRYAHIRNLT